MDDRTSDLFESLKGGSAGRLGQCSLDDAETDSVEKVGVGPSLAGRRSDGAATGDELSKWNSKGKTGREMRYGSEDSGDTSSFAHLRD